MSNHALSTRAEGCTTGLGTGPGTGPSTGSGTRHVVPRSHSGSRAASLAALLAAFVAAFVAALILAVPPAAALEAEDPDPFRLSPGDVVSVSVLEDASLDREVLIRPDGRIAIPIAGTVMAAERTPEELQAELSRRLAKDFVSAPTVTVSLARLGTPEEQAAAQAIIYVTGQVNAPGRFAVEPPITVLRALAIAGGAGPFAATKRIQVRQRAEDGAETVTLFDYAAIEDGAAGGAAIELGDGDVVIVPERGLFE